MIFLLYSGLPVLCIFVFQAKKLEENIEMTRKEIEDSTEVEIELKRRLGQLTDHLIQKQAQVCLSTIFIMQVNSSNRDA